MINTIHAPSLRQADKDGKKVLIPVNPQIALSQRGPVIPVYISHPEKVIEKFKEEGKPVPVIQIQALIDTGASGSVITPRVVQELGLIQTGFQKITSVNNEEEQPQYFAKIQLPWGTHKDISVVACPLKGGIECLIGRDILMHWNFIYNGKDGFITICD